MILANQRRKNDMQWRILIVDDEAKIREAFRDVLIGDNPEYRIDLAASGEEAIVKIKDALQQYDIVLTDEKMGKVSGSDLLQWITSNQFEIDVVMITAFGDVQKAVEVMRSGAKNFIEKPVDSTRLRNVVKGICEYRKLKVENRALKSRVQEFNPEMVVGSSNEIRGVYEKVEKVADTDAVVLIQGESGTGKEVIARALHFRSKRKKKPFVVVNCAALPPTLLENELFGHEREAFTGAHSTRKGRFEQANMGTIFLDEITEMSLENQSRFLRVLEDNGFHRIGGSDFMTVDVRILAASNKDVAGLTKQGKFREDLYYRLNVVPIKIPPLRERKADITVLAVAFLREFALRYNRLNLGFADETLEILNRYTWPGNVRELRNSVERAVILASSDTITPQSFPEIIEKLDIKIKDKALDQEMEPMDSDNDNRIKPGMKLVDIEKELIKRTLESVNGHRRKAAELLGISVRALQYKIKEYQLK
jgi:two-component system, NtrC family, response regulator AtoC